MSAESLGVLRGMPALGGVVVGLGLAALLPMRRSGLCSFAALLCGEVTGFCVSTIFWLACGLVCLWRSRYGKRQYPHDPVHRLHPITFAVELAR